jgi:CHAD domain-containing protein
LAGERIAKVYKRMVKMGEKIGPQSPPGAYHELRKKGKELRYLLELFGAHVYPTKVVKPMIKSLKALQDVLGRHQDRQVQQAMVRSLSDELAALPGGAAKLMAVGALLGALAEDGRATRRQFAERFEAFASPKQRALVKETFA